MQPVIFNYRGNDIAFEGEGRLVNATDMAKPFGKRSNDFLRLAATNEYIQAIITRYGISRNEVVRVIQGGSFQGTWFHPRLALRFAQWLSADFALWVDEKMEELLTTGKTSLSAVTANDLAHILRSAANAIEEGEQAKQRLEIAAPKAEAFEQFIKSNGLKLMREVAKMLVFSDLKGNVVGQNELFAILRESKVLMKDNTPYQGYIDRHYFKVVPTTYERHGEIFQATTTKVTAKGVEFIRKLLLKLGYQPQKPESQIQPLERT